MTQKSKNFFRSYLAIGYFLLVLFPVVVSAGQVTLQWDPNGQTPDGYNLYQRLGNQAYDYSNPLNTAAITTTTYTVSSLIEGQTYHFVVRAFLGNDESGDSNEVSYTVPVSDPDTDQDGYRDSEDAFPSDGTEWLDTDGDGEGNNADTDDDDDGLPDVWESQYELDPLDGTDADGDLDGDGISNQEEYKNGSDPSQLLGNNGPDQPILVGPADGAIDVDLMPTLMTDAFVDVDGHSHGRTQYQIATGTDWTTDLVFEGEFTKQLTGITMGDLILEPETTYYWRVRFYDQHNGRSDWSAVSSFTTIDNVAAGFMDDDGDGILNEQEVAEEDIDPALGNTSQMLVVDTSDDINPQLAVLLSSDADMIIIRSTDPDSVEVGSSANRPEVLTGVISFKMMLLNGARSANVTVNLPKPAPENALWYKYHMENGWTPYSDVTFSSDRKSVTFRLEDGGMGDDDGVQNGIIVDPSGLGYSVVEDGAALGMSTPSSGTSSGCFIAASSKRGPVSYRHVQLLILVSLFGIATMMKACCKK